MDKRLYEIRDEMQRIVHKKKGTEYPLMSGKVKSVDEDSGFCTVELTGDDDTAPTEGVMLNTVSLNNNGFLLYPKVGSDVIVGQIDGPGAYSLIKCSDLVKVRVSVGSAIITMTDGKVSVVDGKGGEMTIEKGKFSFKNGSGDMATIMSGILTHIISMTMNSAMGPTSPPMNLADFTADKTKLGLILQ